jgi:hypothetical protein
MLRSIFPVYSFSLIPPVFGFVMKPNGPKGASSKEDQEACKLELSQTQEMLEEAQKAHDQRKTPVLVDCFPRLSQAA